MKIYQIDIRLGYNALHYIQCEIHGLNTKRSLVYALTISVHFVSYPDYKPGNVLESRLDNTLNVYYKVPFL